MEKPIDEVIRAGKVVPEQDVEGHAGRLRPALPVDGDDGDVEGHAVRIKV